MITKDRQENALYFDNINIALVDKNINYNIANINFDYGNFKFNQENNRLFDNSFVSKTNIVSFDNFNNLNKIKNNLDLYISFIFLFLLIE